MINYKLKDEARKLYQPPNNWHIFEIENKLGIRCTDVIIPPWMIRKRNEYEIAKQKREAKNLKLAKAWRRQYEKKLKLEERERNIKLRKRAAKQVKEMATKIAKDNAFTQGNKLKECPVNNWLMR